MAGNNTNQNRRRPAQHRRRRPSGIPVMLVIVLLIIAMLMGALAGYVIARKTDTHLYELQEANDRITELENTLTLIGYPVDDEADPQAWLYDNNAGEGALSDLDGSGWNDAEDDLWVDDGLLTGTLPEDTDPVVVAEYDGGQLMSSDVIPEYNDRLTTLIFAGYSAEEVAESTMNEVLAYLVSERLIAAKAQELGLTELNEEDLARINAEASEAYESQLADYIAFADNGGGSREDAAQHMAEENGVTLESITEELKANWWSQKYREHVVQDVTVSDEEIQAYYDKLMASQKETYTAYPDEFEYAHMTGETIVFHPEGYRAVRDILIAFTSEQDADTAAALVEQVEGGSADDGVKAQMDALFAPLEATAQQVQEKLAAGAPFADLMTEYGCDTALEEEPLRSEGYYISDNSYVNSVEYVEGAMMLEQPGQVSAPLRSMFGVHLVEYIGDVTPGEVPLADVVDAIRAAALSEKQDAYFEQHRQALLEAANVHYYPERLR